MRGGRDLTYGIDLRVDVAVAASEEGRVRGRCDDAIVQRVATTFDVVDVVVVVVRLLAVDAPRSDQYAAHGSLSQYRRTRDDHDLDATQFQPNGPFISKPLILKLCCGRRRLLEPAATLLRACPFLLLIK